MLYVKPRTPIMEDLYLKENTTIKQKSIRNVIDDRAKQLKKDQALDDVIVSSLKSLANNYIEEQKLKITLEHEKRKIAINNNTKYRSADITELKEELKLVLEELSDLRNDYDLLQELYKNHNILNNKEFNSNKEG